MYVLGLTCTCTRVSPVWIKICAVIPSLHYRKLQGRTKALESNVQFIVGSVRATIGLGTIPNICHVSENDHILWLI